jgi:hypothetical protein
MNLRPVLTPNHVGKWFDISKDDGSFILMITIVFPFDEGEFTNLLHSNGLEYKTPTENFRYDEDYNWCRILVDVIESPYALPSLATAIVSYIKKDSHRKAIIKSGDKEIDLSGHSAKDAEKILNNASVVSILKEDADE